MVAIMARRVGAHAHPMQRKPDIWFISEALRKLFTRRFIKLAHKRFFFNLNFHNIEIFILCSNAHIQQVHITYLLMSGDDDLIFRFYLRDSNLMSPAAFLVTRIQPVCISSLAFWKFPAQNSAWFLNHPSESDTNSNFEQHILANYITDNQESMLELCMWRSHIISI